jgi:hypothetical protein
MGGGFMLVMFQLLLGWFYGHFFEYVAHRWVFHNRKLRSAFKNHYSQHHARSRKGCMVDVSAYKKISIDDWELRSLIVISFIHLPFCFWFPYFYGALIYSAAAYFFIHRKSHQNYVWSRKYTPWHYDHHMGPNSNMNWGVRLPLIDWLMGTREVYKGSHKEIIRYTNYEKWGKYEIRSRRNKRREH